MTLNTQMQANPEDFAPDLPAVERAVKALEDNKKALERWFWKALLAFNLVLWSLALALAFVLKVR